MLAPIDFEEWELKLPWVKAYNTLIAQQDLSPRDCEKLPFMKVGAMETHGVWASREKNSSLTRSQIEEKFQIAVSNIVARFCTPIEGKYQALIKQLRSKTPERDDHESLSEELRAQYLAAVEVRSKAAISKLSRGQLKVVDAAKQFDQAKQEFIERYESILKHDNQILEARVSEIRAEEDKREATSRSKNSEIQNLQQEISELTQNIQDQLIKIKPVVHNTLLKEGAPPTPPPPPSMSGATTSTQATRKLATKSSRAQILAQQPSGTSIYQNFFSTLLGSHINTSHQQAVKNENSSIDDMELALTKNILTIYQIEQLSLLVQERDTHQQIVTNELQHQKKSLNQLFEQIRHLERPNEPEVVIVDNTIQESLDGSPQTVLPPPLPPKPAAILPASQNKKTEEKDPLQVPSQNNDNIAFLREHFKGFRKKSGYDSDEEEEAVNNTRDPASEEKNRLEEDRAVTLDKYSTKKQALYLAQSDEYKQNFQQQIEKIKQKTEQISIVANTQAIAATIAQFNLEINQLTGNDSIPKLEEPKLPKPSILPSIVALVPQVVNKIAASSSEKNESSCRKPPALPPRNPPSAIDQPPQVPPRDDLQPLRGQPPALPPRDDTSLTYMEKINSILKSDPAAQRKFQDAASDKVLHNALNKADIEKLDKAIIVDLLILRDYAEKKCSETQTKKFSSDEGQIYTSSVKAFYNQALDIRLSGLQPEVQQAQLKAAAKKHFEPRHGGRRLFADAALMIGTLLIGTLFVGIGRVATGHTFFFCLKNSTREQDFRDLLKKEVSDDQGLLNSCSPAA